MRNRVILGAGILLALLIVQAHAATPSLINYQGRLTNAGGSPIPDGNYSVVFTVYDAASGGTGKWTETQSVATSGGLFAVLLGTINPISDTVFNSSTRYLATKVGVDPELSPRTRLVSVPYAERVSTIDGSTGGTISGDITLGATATIYKGVNYFIHNTGIANTFVGNESGNLTLTGGFNSAIGSFALYFNTTGYDNTACGMEALYSNTTGFSNTAIGKLALDNNDVGGYNTASGSNALYFNQSGSYNTASGSSALYSNTTGSNNTATGYSALFSNSTGIYNTATGLGALYSNTTGNYNTANGQGSLQNNTTGDGNTAVGQYALSAPANGTNNTAIGYQADILYNGLTNATAIGANAYVNASNKIRLGDDFVTVIEGWVPYTFASDRNKKENFQPIDGNEVLRKISGFKMTSWNYKNNDPAKFRHYGPMAQEFFEAFGHDGVGQIGDSVTINSGDEAGILFVAVQALEERTAEVEAVKSENRNLRSELDDLKRKVNQLLAQSAQDGASKYSIK